MSTNSHSKTQSLLFIIYKMEDTVENKILV